MIGKKRHCTLSSVINFFREDLKFWIFLEMEKKFKKYNL